MVDVVVGNFSGSELEGALTHPGESHLFVEGLGAVVELVGAKVQAVFTVGAGSGDSGIHEFPSQTGSTGFGREVELTQVGGLAGNFGGATSGKWALAKAERTGTSARTAGRRVWGMAILSRSRGVY